MEDRIMSIIRENLERKCDVRLDSRLVEDLRLDSFSMLMIINDIEDKFSIHVDEDNFVGLKTVADICKMMGDKYPSISSGGK